MKEDLDRPLPLRRAVEEALAIFGQGFVSHPDNGALRAVLVDGSLGGKELFNQLVRLVYRVIFLLTVEDRELLHLESTSVAARKRYREGYRIGRLRDPREHNGIWESIKRVFRGVGTGDARLGLPGLAGIFKADRCPALDAAALDDRSARLAVAGLLRLNWRDMASEELGELYEGLLELVPQASSESFAFAGREPESPNRRHATGTYYTPVGLVQVLLDSALEPVVAEAIEANPSNPSAAVLALAVVDPACGSGHFLLGAARRLAAHVARCSCAGTPTPVEHRLAMQKVVRQCIFGVDLSPMAVELCQMALWLEAADPGLPLDFAAANVRVGNAILGATIQAMGGGSSEKKRADAWCASLVSTKPRSQSVEALSAEHQFFHWHIAFPAVFARGGFDVVLGNPPYLNQLESDTAVSRGARRLLVATFGPMKKPFTDQATLFLVAGLRLLRPGGRQALVHPLSCFAAADAGPARRHLAEQSSIASLWMTTEHIFPAASVFVASVCLVKGGPRITQVSRRSSNRFLPAESLRVDMDALAAESTWGQLVADLFGVPPVTLSGPRRIRDIAGATADFRDQFYGLAPHIVEDGPTTPEAHFPPLIVAGLVDPAVCLWGQRSCKFAKKTWQRPRVDLASLNAAVLLAGWAQGRLVPKIVVATQTRVVEAFADPTGAVINTVPTITVTPTSPEDLWRLLAVLLSPPVSAWALGRYAASALSMGAIKLSATQLGQIPLPTAIAPWDEAAVLVEKASRSRDARVREASLLAAAARMCDAYETPREPVLSWWRSRYRPD